MDSRFLTELQLQFLTDKVAEALAEKHKYIAELSGRRQNAVAKVWDWLFLRTTQRIIEVGNHQTYGWFPVLPTATQQATFSMRERLVRLIVHEISHFKNMQRMRTRIKKYGRPGFKRHRHHNKRFFQIEQQLREKIRPHLEMLTHLDLTQIQPSPPKLKPTKTEVYSTKLATVQKHIKQLQTRKKRLETAIKKWRKKEKYLQKKRVETTSFILNAGEKQSGQNTAT